MQQAVYRGPHTEGYYPVPIVPRRARALHKTLQANRSASDFNRAELAVRLRDCGKRRKMPAATDCYRANQWCAASFRQRLLV